MAQRDHVRATPQTVEGVHEPLPSAAVGGAVP